MDRPAQALAEMEILTHSVWGGLKAPISHHLPGDTMLLAPQTPLGEGVREALVPSGRTWSAGFRKSQGAYFVFSLFLSERCVTNPRSQAPWCCGTTLVFGVLETPFVSHVCMSR